MTLQVKTALTIAPLFAAVLLTADASARDDMSGTWREDFTETTVSVEQWSPACGPTPKTTGRKRRGLKFEVEDRGIDLVFAGRSGRFSSVDCQTRNKAVKPKERTVKDSLFMISCSTKEDANQYENGLYSFRIKGPKKIQYRETTRFSRNASGSMCVHTKRIRRSYTKLADAATAAAPAPAPEPDPTPTPDPVPAPEPAPPPTPADPCASPGAVVSVSIEPSRAEVRAGEQVCLEVMATDKDACEVPAPLSFRGRAPKHIQLTPKGCLAVSRKAKPGERSLRLLAGGVQTELELVIGRPAHRVAHRPHPAPDQPEPEDQPAPSADEPAPAEEPVPAEEPAVAEEPAPALDGGPALADGVTPVAAEDGGPEAVAEPAPTLDAGPSAAPVAPPAQEAAAAEGEPTGIPLWAWAAVGGGGTLLILAIVLFVVLSRRKGRAPAGFDDDEDLEPVVPKAQTVDEMAASFGLDESLADQTEPPAAEPPADGPAQDASGVICNACGAALPAGAEFCTSCGNRLESHQAPGPEATPSMAFCINCGESIPAVAKFCPFCATKQG